MDFKDLAITRITPKFGNGNNFKNVLRFTTNIFDNTLSDVEIIKDLKNMGSSSTIVLDEIGKLLGVYPRPFLESGVQGEGFFTYGLISYDSAPYASIESNVNIRPLTDPEYTRVLRAASILTVTNGTIEDAIKFFSVLSGGTAFIVNKASTYDIIIKKDLSQFDKNLIEFLSKDLDNLTVSKGFLGTTDDQQPFQYGVTGYGTSPYIKSW